jgi:peptidyl-prolyl cis-trans isomerase SurA
VIARGARGGVDFNRIAQSYEAAGDPVTGGNSGLRTADRLPESFVQAVAKLPVGEIAPVLRTPAGFHIIRLVERRGGGGETVSAPVRQTRARHILMRINETNPEPEVLRRMNEIRERIVAGTVSFEDMARQYSVDGSAGQGGDLGWIYPGDTVPDFETAMNLLKPGEISPAVRSPFGYHLIQVQERRTDEASPERARSAARNAIRLRKSNEGYQEWSSQARDRAYIEYRIEDQ